MPVPETTATERCGSQCCVSRCQLSFSEPGRSTTAGIRVVLLERRERLDGLAEALLVGQERPPRAQHVRHAGALERAQLAAEHRLGRERRSIMGARAAHADDRRVVLGPQPLQHVGRVGGDLDAEDAQVVLERLDEVGIDRQRAAVGLAGGQREERRDRVRVPVDVERQARLADAVDERQRRRRRRLADLQPGRAAQRALVEPRAAQLEQRLGDRLRERQPEPSAELLGGGGELVRQLAGDRLQHERAAPAEPRRADAPTQPLVASASHALTSSRRTSRTLPRPGWIRV